jgi:hypothetical protein
LIESNPRSEEICQLVSNPTIDGPDRPRPPEDVVAEYETAHSAYLQYDGFRWQAGSLLIAGAFVFLGLLSTTSDASAKVGVGALVVTGVMSIWILYAQHYRQLYLFKLDRVLELELVMGAQQHSRFNPHTPTPKTYPRRGPRGHNLDLGVYVIVTVAGPALALAGESFSGWSVVSLGTTVGIVVWVLQQERQTQRWLRSNRFSQAQPTGRPRELTGGPASF